MAAEPVFVEGDLVRRRQHRRGTYDDGVWTVVGHGVSWRRVVIRRGGRGPEVVELEDRLELVRPAEEILAEELMRRPEPPPPPPRDRSFDSDYGEAGAGDPLRRPRADGGPPHAPQETD